MLDRVVGILLGLVLGVAIVAGFVFLGSEDTIDAPSLGGNGGRDGAPAQPPVRTIEVIGGMPPQSGAPTFDYETQNGQRGTETG